MNSIFYLLHTAANGKRCQDFMEHQAPYTIDLRSDKTLDYLRICGKLVYWSMIMKKG